MKFLGFKRVNGYLGVARNFKKGDIFHPAAVFSHKVKGEEYTLIIPLTTHRPDKELVDLALDEEGKKIVIDTSTNGDEHFGNIVLEVVIKKGRFQTRGFSFRDYRLFKNASAAVHYALKNNDFCVHNNNNVKDMKEKKREIVVALRTAIKSRFEVSR